MRKFTFALAVALTPALLSAPAYAADVGVDPGVEGAVDTTVARLLGAMDDLVDVMEQGFAVMVANPLLAVFLAASLLTAGISIFRKIKRAARG